MLLGSPLYQLEMTSLIRSEVYSDRFRASKTNSILNRWNLDQSLFKYRQVQLHSSYESLYILDTIFLDLQTYLRYIYTPCLECTQCLCHFFFKEKLDTMEYSKAWLSHWSRCFMAIQICPQWLDKLEMNLWTVI